MIVKWTTQRGYAEIKRKECTRETEKSVWFMRAWYAGSPPKEYKAYKVGVNIEYHDTRESARDYLLDEAESRVIAARRNLEICNSYYGNVEGLKKPAEACDE